MNTSHSNEELQKMIIGALLSSKGNLYPEIFDIIKPEQFAGRGKVVYTQILLFFKNKHPISIQTLICSLGFSGYAEYLTECDGPFEAAAVFHAKILAERLKRERVKTSLREIADLVNDDFPVADQLEDVRELWLKESGTESGKNYDIVSVTDRFKDSTEYNRKNGLGHSTGFDFMDSHWITYRPGHIMMIGGFTSVGKTALLTEMCVRLLSGNAKVGIISTEMTEDQMVSRIIANRTGINANVLLSGNKGCDVTLQWLKGKKISIIDNVRTVNGIYSACRKMQLQGGLDVVFIDYVQNLKLDGKSRYEAMAEAATFLQGMAKELRCTVVCMSQRSNQSVRDDKGMAEYKNSGELAAVADVGIILLRHKTEKNKLMVDIRKNRHGMIGEFYLKFDDGFTRLEEI